MIKIKNSVLVLLIVMFVFSCSFDSSVKAAQGQNMNQEQNTSTTNQQNQERNQEMNQENNTTTTSQQNQEQNHEMNQEQNTSITGQQNQEQNQNQQQTQTDVQIHKSTVANFVQGLLEVADREAGIGEQVRIIAQQQNQSASTTIQAIQRIQTRSRMQTFLFGSDYKNLGMLRSEMVQTQNRLEQLNRLMENVQNEGDRTVLQNQIQALEQEQTRMANFIGEQGGQFSLFGWLIKWFSNTD
jgi:DNA mismatch repair ATPase MutL